MINFLSLDNMCFPVVMNFLIITAQFIVYVIEEKYTHGTKAYLFGLIYTMILHLICMSGYKSVAWVIFLIPIFLFIVLNILLVVVHSRSEGLLQEYNNDSAEESKSRHITKQ